MTNTHRHLIGRAGRTACGLLIAAGKGLPVTNLPDMVTCSKCARTLAMADAEIRRRLLNAERRRRRRDK